MIASPTGWPTRSLHSGRASRGPGWSARTTWVRYCSPLGRQIIGDESLYGFAFDAQRFNALDSAVGIGEGIARLGVGRGLAHGKSADAARRALDGMGDFAPLARIAL